MWENAGLNGFTEVDDSAKYEVVFLKLGSNRFVSCFSFYFNFYSHLIVVVVVGCDVVYSCGSDSLSLAFDVAFDRFVQIGEILVDQSGGQFWPCCIVAMVNCLEEGFFWWEPCRGVIP